MVKININITNKATYSLVLLLVLATAISVYAYNSGKSPSVFGHSAEEIEVTLNNGTIITLSDFVTNISVTQWPAGNYCIVQAQNMACPAGFVATSPRFYQAAGGEFVIGALNPAPQSAAGVYFVDLGDLNFGNLQGQVWAWCCK